MTTATPCCIKCGHTTFATSSGPNVNGMSTELIHCAKCGAVHGVVPKDQLQRIHQDLQSRR